MRTEPFFYAPPDPTIPESPRQPYHDHTDCPEGQRIRASGHWRPYQPTRIADTRVRCPLCRALAASYA